jgi:FdrA protein
VKTANFVLRNRYQDSVTLMQVAVGLRQSDGIEDAALMMGTDPNKEMLAEADLLAEEGRSAGPNDLIVAVRGSDEAIEQAAGRVEGMLRAQTTSAGGSQSGARIPRSLSSGLIDFPDANLVLISTPGIYAATEAQKALAAGRHVMIFSDNVAIEDELRLKQVASERGLLLMGPDCGTGIIGGVPLGFANAVRRGPVGVVGASGTGMQEITSLIHRYGGGISHAIGTGSRDLSARVGTLTTLAGLAALRDDPSTKVIVLVSKPPDPGVARRVLEAAAEAKKPVVICFLGLDTSQADQHAPNITFTSTLEDAARQAVRILSGGIPPREDAPNMRAVDLARNKLKPSQRYVRGLFSGGTFCYEAMLLLQPLLGPIYSNTPLRSDHKVEIRNTQYAIRNRHVCLDMGADEFTVGRPHPMIDMTQRAERLQLEADDPETAVILLDIVLGYGAHPDPAGALAPAIREAKARANDAGRTLPVVVSICGTDRDLQGYVAQKELLETVGAIVAGSNAEAARLAGAIAQQPLDNS